MLVSSIFLGLLSFVSLYRAIVGPTLADRVVAINMISTKVSIIIVLVSVFLEEKNYVANAHFEDRSLGSMAEEFEHLRKANLFLIKSLNETELARVGISNEKAISVKALVFIIAGHLNHHMRILKERYL